ncbi:MAG: hypothetical protein JSR84_01000 [Proteobacteria bacterium]|nr:hypothetical protein [Pseudomonadota bacterium]
MRRAGRSDHSRPRGLVVLIAALGLVAAGATIALALGGGAASRPGTPGGPEATVPATGAPIERVPPPNPGLLPAQRAARDAARRFLRGFLPYSYRQLPAGRIEAIAPPLRRELTSSAPRVPPAYRQLRPRLLSLDLAVSAGDVGIDFVATVDDGVHTYQLRLAVRPVLEGEHGWLVTAVS